MPPAFAPGVPPRDNENGPNGLVGSRQENLLMKLLPAKAQPRQKVSRVSLVLAHDSAAARTNTGSETRL